MIHDLAELSGQSREIAADILVIGGGTVGLIAATRLARAGRRVVVAESGGLTQFDETHPLNQVEQLGDFYTGADAGRFRCLGGTSTRWGGAMLPFLPADLTLRPRGWPADWPISLDVLTRYQGEVEALFERGDGPYEFPSIMPGHFTPRLAKWPAFPLRNVATLFKNETNGMEQAVTDLTVAIRNGLFSV